MRRLDGSRPVLKMQCKKYFLTSLEVVQSIQSLWISVMVKAVIYTTKFCLEIVHAIVKLQSLSFLLLD